MDRKLNILKRAKKQEVKDKFNRIFKGSPRVATALGFSVDGGRNNKDDFKSKWETMDVDETTTVRDADNQFHPNISKSQMEIIWKAIVVNGETLLQEKWMIESQIDACTTIEELEAI